MIAENSPRQLGDYEVTHRIVTDDLGAIYSVRHSTTGATAFARVFSQAVSQNAGLLARHIDAIVKQLPRAAADVLTRGQLADQSVFVIVEHESSLKQIDDFIAAPITSIGSWQGSAPQQPALPATIPQDPPPRSNPRLGAGQPGSDSKPASTVLFGLSDGQEVLGDPAYRQSGDAPLQPLQQLLEISERPRKSPAIRIPLPRSIARLLSRGPRLDPVEQAFAELDPGWFSLDAPGEMQLGVAVKVSAGAIRSAQNDGSGHQQLAATFEHDRAQLEATPLGRLVRVELVPDSEEDFHVRALSAVEQPVLASEITRWEWLVTPRRPGDAKSLRVIATNLVDVSGQRVGKSRPVKTLVVRVEVVGAASDPAISAATLRRICDETMRNDADLEAFCVDSFPQVHARFGRGMERVEKLNLLFSSVPPDQVMTRLREQFPEAVAAISARSMPAVKLEKDPSPLSAQPIAGQRSGEVPRPSFPSLPPPQRQPDPPHIAIPIWLILVILMVIPCILLVALLMQR